MEIKSNIGYEQLIAIINQLPIDEVNRLKAEIEKISSERTAETGDNLQSLVAVGPVMSDEKYNEFEENRKIFRQWRES
jgi:predicted Mrr-cat superfamily restriction endonuclease